MSLPSSKRKARVVLQPDESLDAHLLGTPEKKLEETPQPSPLPLKFGRSKPAKSSSLRRSINVNDDTKNGDGGETAKAPQAEPAEKEDPADGTPVVIRPAISRSGSTKQKSRKRPSGASRLSFGPADEGGGREQGSDGGSEGTQTLTPKRTLGQRVLENNNLRRSASMQSLHLTGQFAGLTDDRPTYTKEFLEELQSSMPSAPRNMGSLRIHDDSDGGFEDGAQGQAVAAGLAIDMDAMDLDMSELEGAVIVPSDELISYQPSTQSQPPAARVMTDSEVRAYKERRHRLAKAADLIALDDSDEQDGPNLNRVISLLDASDKNDGRRLLAEDEDLGEGCDEFVSDGNLALGRKAQGEAARRHRRKIQEILQYAKEEESDDGSDDSSEEGEMRAAYDAAQTRAGIGALQKLRGDEEGEYGDAGGSGGSDGLLPKMKPLPELNSVLGRIKGLVHALENDVKSKRARIDELEKEKGEILGREKKVQEILNQAGDKYKAAMEKAGTRPAPDGSSLGIRSPLRPLPLGIAEVMPVERGLESFGTTPTQSRGDETP